MPKAEVDSCSRTTPVTNSLNSVAYSSKSLCSIGSDICIQSTAGQFVCSPMGTGKKKSGMRNCRGFQRWILVEKTAKDRNLGL